MKNFIKLSLAVAVVLLAFYFIMGAQVNKGGFSTFDTANDTIAGRKNYTAIWINVPAASACAVVTLQASATNIWSQQMCGGDFAVLPFSYRTSLDGLTLTANTNSAVVTAFYQY